MVVILTPIVLMVVGLPGYIYIYGISEVFCLYDSPLLRGSEPVRELPTAPLVYGVGIERPRSAMSRSLNGDVALKDLQKVYGRGFLLGLDLENIVFSRFFSATGNTWLLDGLFSRKISERLGILGKKRDPN